MKHKPDDWMPLHIGEYLADTTHLTRDQHGAYLLLLMAYWRRGEALPADDGQLSAMARATVAEWRKMKSIIAAFFEERDGKWFQKRCESELIKARATMAAKSAAGKKGAKNRWQTNDRTNGTAMADASVSHRQNDAPITNNHNPSSLRSEGRVPIKVVCEAFGIVLTDDVRRLDWPAQLGEMISSGLSLENDILPACAEARKRQIVNLVWVRKRAESEKAKRGIAAQPVAPMFEDTDPRGWKDRLSVFRGNGVWSPKWGPKPGEPGCKVPAEMLERAA